VSAGHQAPVNASKWRTALLYRLATFTTFYLPPLWDRRAAVAPASSLPLTGRLAPAAHRLAWTKTADEILATIHAYLQRINDSRH
jgi:hypothetical protein